MSLTGLIPIDRVVTPRGDGCFVYTIFKSGFSNSINPLPQMGCNPPLGAQTQVLTASNSDLQPTGYSFPLFQWNLAQVLTSRYISSFPSGTIFRNQFDLIWD